jgi:hypothetical protein
LEGITENNLLFFHSFRSSSSILVCFID